MQFALKIHIFIGEKEVLFPEVFVDNAVKIIKNIFRRSNNLATK